MFIYAYGPGNPVVNESLVTYLRNGLNQGYSIQSLRAYLVSQGYPAQEVDEAIAALYRGETPQKKNPAIFFAVLVLIVIAAGGIIFMLSQGHQNEGVTIPHISNQQTTTQSATPSTTTQSEATKLPTGEPKQETPVKQSTTPQDTTVFEQEQREQHAEEVRTLLKDIRSVNDCDQLQEKRDSCILEFSYLKDHVNFCEDIEDQDIRDDCYSRYALRHEEKEQCDSVVNRYSREICDVLLRTAEMLRQQGTKYTLDPVEGKLIYSQDQALNDLEHYVQTKSTEEPTAPSIQTQNETGAVPENDIFRDQQTEEEPQKEQKKKGRETANDTTEEEPKQSVIQTED